MAVRYAYLDTRVSVLASRLTSPASLRERVGEAPVGEAPDGVGVPSRGHLVEAVLRDFAIVVRPTGGSERALLLHVAHWFELGNVKALIRGKFAGLSGDELRGHLLRLGPFSTLALESLARLEDARELLNRLERTAYRDVARHARRVLDEGGDLAAVEAAIDRRYLAGLSERADAVPKRQRRATRALADRVLDWTALVWALRYRFAYRLSPAETYYHLAPSKGELTAARLRTLVRADTPERAVAGLPPAVRERTGDATTVPSIEHALERDMLIACERMLRAGNPPIGRALAYLLRRWLELRQLSAVRKGLQLGFPPDLVRFAAHLGGEPA